MTDNKTSILINVFGTIGTILWTVQLFPQLYLNYRRKTTSGLSPFLYLGWVISGLSLAIYQISQQVSIALQIQPFGYGTLCFIIFIQMLYYDRKFSIKSSLAIFVLYCLIGGGFVFGMVEACQKLQNQGNMGLTIAFGSFSDFFLCAGFLPQFIMIWKDKEVIGFSYIFLLMDSAGAVFSIASLGLDPRGSFENPTAIAGYLAILVLEFTLLGLAIILNPRASRRRKQRLDSESQTVDSTVEAEKTEGASV